MVGKHLTEKRKRNFPVLFCHEQAEEELLRFHGNNRRKKIKQCFPQVTGQTMHLEIKENVVHRCSLKTDGQKAVGQVKVTGTSPHSTTIDTLRKHINTSSPNFSKKSPEKKQVKAINQQDGIILRSNHLSKYRSNIRNKYQVCHIPDMSSRLDDCSSEKFYESISEHDIHMSSICKPLQDIDPHKFHSHMVSSCKNICVVAQSMQKPINSILLYYYSKYKQSYQYREMKKIVAMKRKKVPCNVQESLRSSNGDFLWCNCCKSICYFSSRNDSSGEVRDEKRLCNNCYMIKNVQIPSSMLENNLRYETPCKVKKKTDCIDVTSASFSTAMNHKDISRKNVQIRQYGEKNIVPHENISDQELSLNIKVASLVQNEDCISGTNEFFSNYKLENNRLKQEECAQHIVGSCVDNVEVIIPQALPWYSGDTI